jgi:hypothetical protein
MRIELTDGIYDVEVSASEKGFNDEYVSINLKFTFPYDPKKTLGQIDAEAISLAKANVPTIHHPRGQAASSN